MKQLLLLIAFLICTVPSVADQSTTQKTPLDLPAGGGLANDEDENTPEVINFWGGSHEGEAFYFVLDFSGSMSRLVSGIRPSDVLKREFTQAVTELSSRSWFNVICYNYRIYTFKPEKAVRGTRSNTASAIAWISTVPIEGRTFMLTAMTEAIRIRTNSSKRNSVIILASDGLPNDCNIDEFVELVTVLNTGAMRGSIDTLYIKGHSQTSWVRGIQLMKDTARANRGKFKEAPIY